MLTTHLFLQLFQQEIKVASGGVATKKKRKKECTSFLFTTGKRPIPTLKLLFEEEIETMAAFLKRSEVRTRISLFRERISDRAPSLKWQAVGQITPTASR